MTELLLENAVIAASETGTKAVDIAIDGGLITGLGSNLRVDEPAERVDCDGLLVVGGLVDTHLHLDKTRLPPPQSGADGTLESALAATKAAKASFTPDDVYRRASQTLERCIAQGTTRVRTQVEVDPVVGLRGFEGILDVARDFAWAVDVEICAFPQDGIDGRAGVDLLAHALEKGATVLGGAPYADSDPVGQITTIFDLAHAFDVDIDLHLDLADGANGMFLEHVCRKTDATGYQGRVTVGHLTQMSYLPLDRYTELCKIVADAGVAVTVLPSTDLYLMGRKASHAKPRGVLSLDGLLARGVPCSVATNNVLNAFTPYGDGSLVRMANLYANTCHVSGPEGLSTCLSLVTDRAARVLGVPNYGVAIGNPADLVLLDATAPEIAVAEISTPLWGMKAGRFTFSRPQPTLHRPLSFRQNAGQPNSPRPSGRNPELRFC